MQCEVGLMNKMVLNLNSLYAAPLTAPGDCRSWLTKSTEGRRRSARPDLPSRCSRRLITSYPIDRIYRGAGFEFLTMQCNPFYPLCFCSIYIYIYVDIANKQYIEIWRDPRILGTTWSGRMLVKIVIYDIEIPC